MWGKGSGGNGRKPTAQKLAEGNRGRRPLNLREPKALPGEPEMPSGMTEQARVVWPEVVAMLKANDVLFKTDGLAIAALCSNLLFSGKRIAPCRNLAACARNWMRRREFPPCRGVNGSRMDRSLVFSSRATSDAGRLRLRCAQISPRADRLR
jgi:hypothetical protein